MPSRVKTLFLLLPLLLVTFSGAKNKKPQGLPDYVLHAQTVFIVVHPDAAEKLTNPNANRDAQSAVESAMRKWGRFEVLTDSANADLIITVQRGVKGGPVVTHSPADQPFPPLGGGISMDPQRRGAGSPDVSRVDQPPPGGPAPISRGPQIGNQSGPPEDTFEVYRGGSDYPLSAPPVWRYSAKGALNQPQPAAVDEFRKAVNEAEIHKP